MLTHIQLNHFKSWENLEIELAPLTILFGANSSGKSSVLQALLLLKQTAASFDRNQHINFGGTERDFISLGGYRDLVFSHETSRRINIGLAWISDQESEFIKENPLKTPKLKYVVRWRALAEQIVIERLQYEETESADPKIFARMERQNEGRYKYEATEGQKDTVGRFPLLPDPESCYAIPPDIARYYTNFNPLEFNLQFERLMSRLAYLGPLRRYPRREYLWTGTAPREIGLQGENTVEALVAAERTRPKTTKRKKRSPVLIEQVAEWLKQLKLASAFQIEAIDKDNRYYKTSVQTETDGAFGSLLDVGFGISQILPVITLLFFVPEGSIVLLEQPELHLHPGAQAHLADLLLHVAETRKLQVIVESHSEHLLRRLQRRIAEVESAFATPENIKMYFCEKGSGGSTIRPVNVDIFGQILNWPENFFGDLTGDLEKMAKAALQRARNGR
jgi:predicted ATPase